MILTLLIPPPASGQPAVVPDRLPAGVEALQMRDYGALAETLVQARGDYIAVSRSEPLAVDGLVQAALFAARQQCDVVRGLGLVRRPDGSMGVLGTDLLADPALHVTSAAQLPELLLDVRLDNLLVSRAFLLALHQRSVSVASVGLSPLLAAHLLLGASRIARVMQSFGFPSHEIPLPEGDIVASAEQAVVQADALGPRHGLFLRAALALRLLPLRAAWSREEAAQPVAHLWDRSAPRAEAGILSETDRLALLSALPDVHYPHLAQDAEHAAQMVRQGAVQAGDGGEAQRGVPAVADTVLAAPEPLAATSPARRPSASPVPQANGSGTEAARPMDPGAHADDLATAPPALALRGKSRVFLEKAAYWSPPVRDWTALKRTRNSSLRIACIAEDRVADGLAFEGELLLLTPGNWKRVLRYTKPDVLLVESILLSSTGHWHMGQHPRSAYYDELVSIVDLARKLSIPTVFWITKGEEYHDHYKQYARHFDLICCADPFEAKRLAAEGIRADVLPPCVQPALYNPFRRYDERSDIGLQVLFDGWADVDRLGGSVSVLRDLMPFGLSIIESQYEVFRNRLGALPAYSDSVLGCVTPAGRRTALKYARSYATLGPSLSSRTTQQWMSLEAAASRIPVVHWGRFAKRDIRRDFAVECATPQEFVVEFVRYREDELYRERMAHLGWRAVNQKHTYAHRLQAICRRLRISHDWEEFPRVSLVTPTFRKNMLERCLQTYEQISYPDKELVLVFNGDEAPSHADLGLQAPRKDVVIAHVPGDLFAGAALNMGHLHASGRYCFRMDDDDYYAPNYVTDMVLQARSVDATLFGKPAAPVIFEGDERAYVRTGTAPLVIAPLSALQSGETWIGGNSISGLREFFSGRGYSDSAYGAADTEFVFNLPADSEAVLAVMDPFNMAAGRRKDLVSHTWKSTMQQVKANRYPVARFSELVL